MANAKRVCRHCKERNRVEAMLIVNGAAFCNEDHAFQYASPRAKKAVSKQIRIANRERKKALQSRGHWYGKLQTLVNQWVVQVRDKDEPCFTCGKSDPSIKYDSGHRIHAGRGGADRRRFLEINLHKQCSVNCNQQGGGMPVEYDIALDKKYGAGTAQWLKEEKNHKTLKEQFPTIDDIKIEMLRYRALLRENGVKPNA